MSLFSAADWQNNAIKFVQSDGFKSMALGHKSYFMVDRNNSENEVWLYTKTNGEYKKVHFITSWHKQQTMRTQFEPVDFVTQAKALKKTIEEFEAVKG